jgi:hypothetical protein
LWLKLVLYLWSELPVAGTLRNNEGAIAHMQRLVILGAERSGKVV